MKIKFVPIDKEFEITPEVTVKDFCQDNGIFIKSLCNGLPSCAECRVHIVEGEHNVLPPSAKELSLIGTGYYIDRRRLSCQLRCFGDVTIDVSEQLEKENENHKEKRPQGAIKKDVSESSYAVSGSLLEQEGELGKTAPNRPQKKSSSKGRGGRDRNRNRSQNSEKKSASPQQNGEKRGQKKSSSSRRRSRRRGKSGPTES